MEPDARRLVRRYKRNQHRLAMRHILGYYRHMTGVMTDNSQYDKAPRQRNAWRLPRIFRKEK